MGASRLGILALLLVLLAPLAGAQQPPDLSPVGSVANEVQDQVYAGAENTSGEDLTSEDLEMHVHVDVRSAEFDIAGVVLGGGSAKTTIAVEAELAIRAVNASRVEDAVELYGEPNASVKDVTGFNTSKSVVTADELRAAGGVALEAFQSYQQDLTERYLADTLPQVTILSLAFDWQNTRPAQEAEETREAEDVDPDPREPPLVLAVEGHMRYLDTFSLADLMEDEGNASDAQTPEERLREQLRENQTVPLEQRTAFEVAGIPQLLSIELPPGWMLNLTLTLPQGFTIASATDALHVDEDRQTASYYVDGTGRETELATSGVVTVSDRSLVTTTVFALVLGLGLLLRLPVEFLGFRWSG